MTMKNYVVENEKNQHCLYYICFWYHSLGDNIHRTTVHRVLITAVLITGNCGKTIHQATNHRQTVRIIKLL